ncbi:MAG: tocopherol cyclase family protein [Lachnospiraceae bacterium]|nr:tocopherol cyclase family protein [Lachnospiraceae bacterium]
MRKYFKGFYFKHQKSDQTLCLIAGQADTGRFIQIITNDFSAKVPWTKGNHFSRKGIRLNIRTPRITLTGTIRYGRFSPIRYDIMGPFRFLPMECRHGIISMRHRLYGSVRLNGKTIDFTDGVGYIEMDSGCSFPSSYLWIQANEFISRTANVCVQSEVQSEAGCSIMAAAASIPFCGLHFRGCICVIQYEGKEYRLATYLGVRVVLCTENRLILKQGRYRLDIRMKSRNARRLSAPAQGKMTRRILEAASCPAEFAFYVDGICRFHLYAPRASLECVGSKERRGRRNIWKKREMRDYVHI